MKDIEESSPTTLEKASVESVNQGGPPTAEAAVATNAATDTPSGTNDPKKRTPTASKGTPTKRKRAKK